MRLVLWFILMALCPQGFAFEFGKPVSGLPAHIKAPDSGLSLVADFEHPNKGRFPVYLVNRSGKDISLRTQDGDVFLKLEYRDSKGAWKRAEPHQDSMCGNSYFPLVLRDNHFLDLIGYQPSEGEPAEIRFRLYSDNPDLASNVGRGVISVKDIQVAAIDDLAIRTGDFALVSAVARGTLSSGELTNSFPASRYKAMWILADDKFDRAESEKVLVEIAKSKEERYSGMAKDLLRKLRERIEKSGGR
jgi:hypothetical protein